MNIFRSEEHVKSWPLYFRMAEDYIMPVADWAEVFSGPLFRRRLEPDYLENAEEYFRVFRESLRAFGKQSPFWQYPMISEMNLVRLSRYCVVGNYTRYEEEVLNTLKDIRFKISEALREQDGARKNFLIWAAPGSGKTFFAQQIAKELAPACDYQEINLAKYDQDEFKYAITSLLNGSKPTICLVDEVDAQPTTIWPYESLLPILDQATSSSFPLIFIFAGSSGFSLEGMKERISLRSKGQDMLSRIPSENQAIIPPMSFGDRVLIVLSQFVRAAEDQGRELRTVEKLGLYYVALNEKLSNARQLREFAVRAVERIPQGDTRLKYDNLFSPGDPENKRFWQEVSSVAQELVNHFVEIEP
ncbi:MAG: ATP-binding protein [Anaerolineales bacterium]|nr:MAG: ATP-binding protein [Anaerolineales bacterium]